MVFPKDLEAGKKICRVLSENYRPLVVIFKKGRLFEVLKDFDLVVAVMAVGIAVRLICQYLRDKWTDTPVVAVDSALRFSVPVTGGHHGANDLALFLGEKMGITPAITTATDARGRPSLEQTAKVLGTEITNREASKEVNLAFLREDVPVLRLKGPQVVVVDSDVAVLKARGIVVGIGARKGISCQEVLQALDSALEQAGRRREEIRVIATAWIKKDELGIKEAAKAIGKDVIYLSEHVLNSQKPKTLSRASDLGLLGVAEPAAMALSERLIMSKKVYGRVTVALGD